MEVQKHCDRSLRMNTASSGLKIDWISRDSFKERSEAAAEGAASPRCQFMPKRFSSTDFAARFFQGAQLLTGKLQGELSEGLPVFY